MLLNTTKKWKSCKISISNFNLLYEHEKTSFTVLTVFVCLFTCLITKFLKSVDPKMTLKVFNFQYYAKKLFFPFISKQCTHFVAAVVSQQHLVWHHETCIQMAVVHIAASCVTLVKQIIPISMSLISSFRKQVKPALS